MQWKATERACVNTGYMASLVNEKPRASVPGFFISGEGLSILGDDRAAEFVADHTAHDIAGYPLTG